MRFTLRKKIIFLIISLLVVSIVVSSLISTFEIQKYYKARIFDQMRTQLDEVDFLLEQSDLDFSQPADYQYWTHYARASEKRLTLIDSTGVVLFDSNVPLDSLSRVENHLNRPEIQIALQDSIGRDERISATIDKSLFYVAKIFSEPDHSSNVHFIRLAIPMRYVETILATVRWKIMAAGGMALVVIIVISYLMASYLTYPIHRLSLVAKQIKQGDLNARFEHDSDDELGELADLLNDMLDKLRDDLVQMKKLQKMRSQFLGNVSHELRTPIFTVQGYLETMMQNPDTNAKNVQKFIRKAYRQAVRLNNLLNDLIDISRIESGEMEMTFSHFSVHEWLKKFMDELQETAADQGVTIRLKNIPDQDVQVWGDRERLNQVIWNLAQNAIKYNVPGGHVELGYVDQNNKVEIFVADTGRGITQEHIPRIFERFYRVDKERSRAVGGTGLGLAIVKHIIEAHRSKMQVQSHVGVGSRFSFKLRKA